MFSALPVPVYHLLKENIYIEYQIQLLNGKSIASKKYYISIIASLTSSHDGSSLFISKLSEAESTTFSRIRCQATSSKNGVYELYS